jgi:integrase
MQEPEKPKRERGTGMVYQPKRKNGKRSRIQWIKFYVAGKAQRESSGSPDERVAEKLLRRRLGEIEADRYVPPARVRVDELVQDVIRDYKLKGRKSTEHVQRRWECHLKNWFTRRKASEVSTNTVMRYIESREKEGAKPASINRELAIIRRAFNLARKTSPPKIAVVPFIPFYAENNRRVGFLETQQETRLADECGRVGLWLRTAFEIGLTFGWRRSEVRNLKVRQVNLLKRTLSLDAGSTKNGEGRTVRLTDALVTLLGQCIQGKQPNDAVLTRADKKGVHHPVKDFRKIWHGVCCRAGLGKLVCPKCRDENGERIAVQEKRRCPNCGRKWSDQISYEGLLFHDLRRSMARNMRNEGVAEEVIMDIGGWKTASVFKRYSIVNPNDTANAIRAVEAARKRDQAILAAQGAFEHSEPVLRTGTISGMPAAKPVQTANSDVAVPAPAPLPN